MIFSLANGPTWYAKAQTSAECGSPRIYSSRSSTEVNLNRSNWIGGTGSFSSGQIAKFDDGRNYNWTENNFNLGGLILRNSSSLTLNRSNAGNNPSFTISGNCIIIGSGSTLNLRYITAMENVSIIIEEGGKLVMDSRLNSRNDFFLDNVQINLQGPRAQLDFGDANIVVGSGGVSIAGYVGGGCDDSNGNVRSTNAVSQDGVCSLFGVTSLPVEYLYFEANFKKQERLVALRWATGKEWENSHFEVERAVGDLANWETIAHVEGMGFSDAPVYYELKDKEVPLVGGNVFYRLKQVDFDGTFAYSKVVSTRIPAIEVTHGVWRAFPNPTNGENFRLSLIDQSRYQGEAINLRLVHPMIFTPPQTVASETEMNARIEELVRNMPKGVFVVEIQWGRKVEHIKVMKQ
ncbi:MAG: T9SS type A sorting domain-containing protein [Cecembia sp.]